MSDTVAKFVANTEIGMAMLAGMVAVLAIVLLEALTRWMFESKDNRMWFRLLCYGLVGFHFHFFWGTA